MKVSCWRRGSLVGAMMAAGIAAGAWATASAPVKTAPPFEPLLSVHDLMEGQQAVMKSLKAGVLDKRWKDARIHAGLLAELGNVNRQHAEDEKYGELAGNMSEAAKALAEELKKPDAKTAAAGLSKLGATCKACHDIYQK